MARTRSRTPKPDASESPEEIAERHAAADRAMLEALQAKRAESTEEPEQEEEQVPTIADRFVGLSKLLVQVRQQTRLGEATLTKILETALQYHAWDYQRRAQEQQNQLQQMFSQMSGGQGESEELIGPEPNEVITASEDNIVPVDFTPAKETTDAE